ncbi:MAG: alkaline phosphatase [Armatimonadota bacterium]|nr:alkaline phosphatase [Armatimonadota bacterium]
MFRRSVPLLCLCVFSLISSVNAVPIAKNVIIMISDGCGWNHITATDYYQYGSTGNQVYESYPVIYGTSTYSYGNSYNPTSAWTSFDYVMSGATDSAASATAMATGEKTLDAAIGMDANSVSLKSILEYAKDLGKSIGVVTSVPLSHATPAGFAAHNVDRYNYEQISSYMINDSAFDVIMGTGNPWYDANGVLLPTAVGYQYVGGQATWDNLVSGTAGGTNPWALIQTRSDFQALGIATTTPIRVIGVPQVFDTLQQLRGGNANADPYVVPLTTTVPTLAEMTRASINVLDNNPNGFAIMIEGGAIDFASHSNQSGRMIEEEIDFNGAVDAVNTWVNANSNWDETLVIVTADHETGYVTGPGSDPTWIPIVNNGAGNMPGFEWHQLGHSNSLVRTFAKGPGSEILDIYATNVDPVRGNYIDNTDIFRSMYRGITKVGPVAAKEAVNLAPIKVIGGIVTAAFDSYFYIESDDRRCGIRVDKACHGVSIGNRADIDGSVKTLPSGERTILATKVISHGTGSVEPLFLSNNQIGGEDWFYDSGSGAGQMGITGARGMNNVGLLVRTFGKITSKQAPYFWLDDGSGVKDYTVGKTGMKILQTYGVLPAVGNYVCVTGISMIYKGGTNYYRLIKLRNANDLVILQ